MALLFCESFDVDSYANRGWGVWGAPAPSYASTNGRTANYALCPSVVSGFSATWATLFGGTTLASGVLSFALRLGASRNQVCEVGIADGATCQLRVVVATDGTLTVQRNTTVVGTAVAKLADNTWYYFNLEFLIDPTSGSAILDKDGATVITFSGNTRASANSYTDSMYVQNNSTSGGVLWIDDIVLADLTGTVNKTRAAFRGAQVCASLPGGAGTTTQWTPSAGNNYACVDENPSTSDTDYVQSSTLNQIDTYAMADITPTTGTIAGVQTSVMARKDDGTTRKVAPVVRSGGADYVGTDVTMTASYVDNRQIREVDPATTNPWTIAGVNGVEVGVKVTT